MEQWAPPGFRVEQVLGSGAAGELWRAREEATGEVVVLQRLHGSALLATSRAWAALSSPYVVGVREVLDDGDVPVLVLDPPAVEPLAALLRRRGRLSAGEAVTVGVPVAQALASAHAAGLVHGALAPSSVLVTAGGMPLLGDLGTGDGTPEGDVRALVDLCRQLLGATRPLGVLDGPAQLPDDVPEALAVVLEQAGADPPSAAELARRLRGAHPAAPLERTASRRELGPPLPGSREWVAPAARHRSRVRRARRPVGPVLVTVVAALVLAGGWVALRPGAPPAAPPDWVAVVQELDRARERAWAAGDPALLEAVYVPGSPPAQADAAALGRLRRQGRTAVGVRHEVVRAEALSVDDARVALRVVDVLGPQEVRDERGGLVERRVGRPERAYEVVLLRTPAGWRLAEVT